MLQNSGQSRPATVRNPIQHGDMAPWWEHGADCFVFDSVPGRYIVMAFCGSARDTADVAALKRLSAKPLLAYKDKASFFAICSDSNDKDAQIIQREFPLIRFLWDGSDLISQAYGMRRRRSWVILNPMSRVVNVIPFESGGGDPYRLFQFLDDLPPASLFLGFEAPPPVLILSDVIEPNICNSLIKHFDENGGRESGFMQEIGGKAVEVHDHSWKRRRDHMISDVALIRELRHRIAGRVVPEMWKAFRFRASRIERDLIGCYMVEDDAHFGPNRDDTVKATVHRRFDYLC